MRIDYEDENCVIINGCTIMKDKGEEYLNSLDEEELKYLVYDLYRNCVDVQEYIETIINEEEGIL